MLRLHETGLGFVFAGGLATRVGFAGGVGGCGEFCVDGEDNGMKSSKSKSVESTGSMGEAPDMNGCLTAMGVGMNCESIEGVVFEYNGLAEAFADERKSLNSSSS